MLTYYETALLIRLSERPRSAYELQSIAYFHGFSGRDAELAVFPALERLEREGLITSNWYRNEHGRLRIFSISTLGRRIFLASA